MSNDIALRRLSHFSSALNLSSSALTVNTVAANHFSHITVAPPDEVFNVSAKFKADTDPKKVDLGVGAYRDDNGKPLVLNVVKKAEARILADLTLNKEYLTIDGDAKFVKHARELMFGADSRAIKENRVASAQCLSGTGSLRMGFEFIAKYLPKGTTVYVSKPTWGNHMSVVQHSLQGLAWKYYRYWDAKNRKLDLDGFLADLRSAPNGSVILLHACAHNPTGVDPTRDEWKQIAAVIREKNHLPFFDSAYQGFATGSLEGDAWAVRYFVEEGFQLFAAQSFAKNFGLYNERIGLLTIVTGTPKEASAVLSQLKIVIRANYSNPPSHGARIVATVLSDAGLFNEWKEELQGMSGRIISMRKALRGELERMGTPGDWSHITSQIGMFSFTGLTPKQCELLSNKYHIYLLSSGRISVAGLNTRNYKHVATAIDDAVRNVKN